MLMHMFLFMWSLSDNKFHGPNAMVGSGFLDPIFGL